MNHIDDPLAYLYEELPLPEMSQAREHLAACPQCRDEIRTIRDTVKSYRDLPRPVVPAGLAARTVTAVRQERRQRKAAESIRLGRLRAEADDLSNRPTRLLPEVVSAVDPETDFARQKARALREQRRGWLGWLFHPAWAVVASVLLLCALWIHVSPRKDPGIERGWQEVERGWESLASRFALFKPASPPPPAEAAAASPHPDVEAAGTIPPPPATRTMKARALPAPHALVAGAPTEQAQTLQRQPTVVMMADQASATPPRIVARPTPVDREASIRTLLVLIGEQRAAGEFAEARQSIALLEQYDPEEAKKQWRELEQAMRAAGLRDENAGDLPELRFVPLPDETN